MIPPIVSVGSATTRVSDRPIHEPEATHAPQPRPRVALLVETSNNYGRALLEGISRFIHTHHPWAVFLELRDLSSTNPLWLDGWDGDGVISRFTTPELADVLARTGVPTIDLTDRFGPSDRFPQVWSDNDAIGKLVADHFIERGFRNFAACGFTGEHWSRERCAGFARAVRAAGFECDELDTAWLGHSPHAVETWEEDREQLMAWLVKRPLPLAVMTPNDVRGSQVIDACGRAGLACPEQVAVVGVDDDLPVCALCEPPLSSVRPDAARTGYIAAELLSKMMAGETVPLGIQRTPPLGITTRQSSDTIAIDDPDVATALRYIREHACLGATVEHVLEHVDVSRSALERRFRKLFGHSPQAAIRQVQLRRVRDLLVNTDLPLDRIANLTGFKHTEHMVVVFKREVGETPGRYRRGS